MRKTFLALLLGIGVGAGLVVTPGCGCDDKPPPIENHASLSGCSGTSEDQVACCSYDNDVCSYIFCRDSACGDWTEESWSC